MTARDFKFIHPKLILLTALAVFGVMVGLFAGAQVAHAQTCMLDNYQAAGGGGLTCEAKEVFIDEGDIDMKRVIQILKNNNFDGVVIPDHTPEVSCSAPWHAGMAHAMGYLKALID